MCAEDAMEVALVGKAKHVRSLGDRSALSQHMPRSAYAGVLSPCQRREPGGSAHRSAELILRHTDRFGQLGQGRVAQVRTQSLQDRGEANEKVRIRFGRRGMLRGGAFEFGEQERELRGDRLK